MDSLPEPAKIDPKKIYRIGGQKLRDLLERVKRQKLIQPLTGPIVISEGTDGTTIKMGGGVRLVVAMNGDGVTVQFPGATVEAVG